MYRILIIDDEPAVLNAIRRVIGKDGRYQIIGEAFSVKQAKIMIEEQKPDIIFTDIKMPGETGIDLLAYIMEKNHEILTVVLSGYDNFDYVHDAFMYGAEEYLLKPIEPSKVLKLLDKIAQKIDKRRMLANPESILNEEKDSEKETGESRESRENKGNKESYKSNAEIIVDKIDAYLKENLSADNSIVVICKRFAISQPYLSKTIKKVKNCTYNEYLISLKLAQAKKLLKTRPDLLIADISEQTGFSDQFYFSRVFKNITGLTPTEFRNEQNA